MPDMTWPELSSVLTATAKGSSEQRAATLERLLDQLLTSMAGLSPRATDGLILVREEVSSGAFFAVGKVFMIADQTPEPVSFAFTFAGASLVSTGLVNFGLADGQLPRGINSRARLESALMAYPHEAAQEVPWAYKFQAKGSSWVLA
jgi:hypothetical protein